MSALLPDSPPTRLERFDPADVRTVQTLIHRTMDARYTGVYPPGAVAWFKGYHSLDAILERAASGLVVVVRDGGAIVATGSLIGREICAVFVAPESQGQGLGSLVMDGLEAAARAARRTHVRLSVSLPSRGFYEARGYRLTDQLSDDVGGGEWLDYWEGVKCLVPAVTLPELEPALRRRGLSPLIAITHDGRLSLEPPARSR